ncbi:DGAT2D, partial [Symbiodinium necroappetens]
IWGMLVSDFLLDSFVEALFACAYVHAPLVFDAYGLRIIESPVGVDISAEFAELPELPRYTFGESETYFTLGGFEKLRLWLNGKGIPTVCFWGLPWCPLLPRRHLKLLTFVGPALELPKLPEPTTQQVDEWHQKYVEALRELFDRHKAEACLLNPRS